MKTIATPLKDCYVIHADLFGDERGFFMESFNQKALEEQLGNHIEIKQVNFASSSKNVLRGLHYQDAPYSQTKIVGVTHGAVLDVVVDIRKDSPTYLEHFKIVLDQPGILLLVPKGFAHGYLSLKDETLFYYFVDAFYAPKYEKGILYKDTQLGIDWKFDEEPIVSEKDQNQPTLDHVVNHF
jgi:dTDP-4-dehydrorhamnose 3,5-epimerase